MSLLLFASSSPSSRRVANASGSPDFLRAFTVAFTKVINKGYTDLASCSSPQAQSPRPSGPRTGKGDKRRGKGPLAQVADDVQKMAHDVAKVSEDVAKVADEVAKVASGVPLDGQA